MQGYAGNIYTARILTLMGLGGGFQKPAASLIWNWKSQSGLNGISRTGATWENDFMLMPSMWRSVVGNLIYTMLGLKELRSDSFLLPYPPQPFNVCFSIDSRSLRCLSCMGFHYLQARTRPITAWAERPSDHWGATEFFNAFLSF